MALSSYLDNERDGVEFVWSQADAIAVYARIKDLHFAFKTLWISDMNQLPEVFAIYRDVLNSLDHTEYDEDHIDMFLLCFLTRLRQEGVVDFSVPNQLMAKAEGLSSLYRQWKSGKISKNESDKKMLKYFNYNAVTLTQEAQLWEE